MRKHETIVNSSETVTLQLLKLYNCGGSATG